MAADLEKINKFNLKPPLGDGCPAELRLADMEAVGRALEDILAHPHTLEFKNGMLSSHTHPVPLQVDAVGSPSVRVEDRKGVACLVVHDPCHTDWEVPEGSGFILYVGAHAYFITEGYNEYILGIA